MNGTTVVDPPAASAKFGDVLMLSDTPVLAGVIMALAQPFAQLRETIGFPPWTPLLVAALASLLIAAYHVQFRRRTRGPEAWLVTPVVALILFSAAIGANNVVDAARKGSSSRLEQGPSAVQELKILQAKLGLLGAQLENERRLNEVLRKVVGTDVTAKPASSALPEPGAVAGLALRTIGTLLVAPAQAQTAEELQTEQEKRVAEALRAYELEQRKLQEESEKIRQRQHQQSTTPAERPDDAPLWKSW